MAIESLIGMAAFTAFMVAVAAYAHWHRPRSDKKDVSSHHV